MPENAEIHDIIPTTRTATRANVYHTTSLDIPGSHLEGAGNDNSYPMARNDEVMNNEAESDETYIVMSHTPYKELRNVWLK